LTSQPTHYKFSNMTKLPASYALKKYIVQRAHGYGFHYDDPLDTEEQIDAAISIMRGQIGYDAQQDVMEGRWETHLKHGESTRHCECDSVAIEDNYGNYIGFPHFHSGGKHFDAAELYDYSVSAAYYLTCEEKEVLTIERSWTKVGK
jgi:hypothetical protein